MEILVWNAYVATVAVVAAWIVWLWKDRRDRPVWRRCMTLLGIGAVSANAAMFWLAALAQLDFLLYRNRMEPAIYALLAVALVCAICGKGASRGLIALCVFFGFFLWVIPGVL
jgi:hypothetical protein